MWEEIGLRASLEDASCAIDSLEGVQKSQGLCAFYAVSGLFWLFVYRL